MLKLPVYLNCHFVNNVGKATLYVYKIEASDVTSHPFQLFKSNEDGPSSWQNLSVYATVDDAVKILLKGLFTAELADEISHGQATVNPAEIVEKLMRGDKWVSLYESDQNKLFRLKLDVNFEDMVERQTNESTI